MNIAFKKFLGQHFILNNKIIDKILKHAGEISGKHIIEIGPGSGMISRAIALRNPKSFTMIEFDKDMNDYIKPILSENIILVNDDALKVNYRDFIQSILQKHGDSEVMIVANLPYNIATNLILIWLQNIDLFKSISVIIQKEVANRFLASSQDDYGRLSLISKLRADANAEFDLDPSNFTPPPKVDSTLISFKGHGLYNDISWREFSGFVNSAFTNPRKTIANNMRSYNKKIDFEAANIEPATRPGAINFEEYLRIFSSLT